MRTDEIICYITTVILTEVYDGSEVCVKMTLPSKLLKRDGICTQGMTLL